MEIKECCLHLSSFMLWTIICFQLTIIGKSLRTKMAYRYSSAWCYFIPPIRLVYHSNNTLHVRINCLSVIFMCSTVLGPGIVSTALQNGTEIRCSTDNLTLSPVRITLRHTQDIEVKCDIDNCICDLSFM